MQDADHAERLGHVIVDPRFRAPALAAATKVLVTTHPNRQIATGHRDT
jgi:hypothetical protein